MSASSTLLLSKNESGWKGFVSSLKKPCPQNVVMRPPSYRRPSYVLNMLHGLGTHGGVAWAIAEEQAIERIQSEVVVPRYHGDS